MHFSCHQTPPAAIACLFVRNTQLSSAIEDDKVSIQCHSADGDQESWQRQKNDKIFSSCVFDSLPLDGTRQLRKIYIDNDDAPTQNSTMQLHWRYLVDFPLSFFGCESFYSVFHSLENCSMTMTKLVSWETFERTPNYPRPVAYTIIMNKFFVESTTDFKFVVQLPIVGWESADMRICLLFPVFSRNGEIKVLCCFGENCQNCFVTEHRKFKWSSSHACRDVFCVCDAEWKCKIQNSGCFRAIKSIISSSLYALYNVLNGTKHFNDEHFIIRINDSSSHSPSSTHQPTKHITSHEITSHHLVKIPIIPLTVQKSLGIDKIFLVSLFAIHQIQYPSCIRTSFLSISIVIQHHRRADDSFTMHRKTLRSFSSHTSM